jgi:hypothetical protein
VECEKEFPIEIEIPTNVADEYHAIFTDFEIEELQIVRNLFDELLTMKRAAFMNVHYL